MHADELGVVYHIEKIAMILKKPKPGVKKFKERLETIRKREIRKQKELEQIEEMSSEKEETQRSWMKSKSSEANEPSEESGSHSEGGESEIEEMKEEAPHAAKMFGPVIDHAKKEQNKPVSKVIYPTKQMADSKPPEPEKKMGNYYLPQDSESSSESED